MLALLSGSLIIVLCPFFAAYHSAVRPYLSFESGSICLVASSCLIMASCPICAAHYSGVWSLLSLASAIKKHSAL
ncbi:hypothetical protein F4860DRAFT_487311, partial [Xylaria cubensis]